MKFGGRYSYLVIVLRFLLNFLDVCGRLPNSVDAGILTAQPKRMTRDGDKKLHVWFYAGEKMQPTSVWKTVQVMVTLDDGSGHSDYTVYQSANKSDVLIAYEENRRFFTSFLRKWSATWQPLLYVSPFTPTYVGIETESDYSIYLKCRNVDYLMALTFVGGAALLFTARRLSRSTGAFYFGGTTVGVAGSLVLVVFLLYKMAPKRSLAISVLLGGWSFVAYVLYVIWRNMYVVLSDYYRYVAIYLVSVAAISFAVSYFYGPPKGVRTLNLIQWALQFVGICMIYAGCQIPSLAVATIILSVILINSPRCFSRFLRSIRYRFFPPKRRFITEAEYIDEGVRETRRALEDLRRFCHSPGCDSWRTISRLQSPGQFAEFVSGRRSHISDEEVLRYSNESEIDTNESEASDDDQSDASNLSNDFSDNQSASHAGDRSFAVFPRVRHDSAPRRYFESFSGKEVMNSSAPAKLTRRHDASLNRGYNGRI